MWSMRRALELGGSGRGAGAIDTPFFPLQQLNNNMHLEIYEQEGAVLLAERQRIEIQLFSR